MQRAGDPDLAARVAEVVSKFHREQQGQAPSACRAEVLPGMAVVLSSGVFTPTENQLTETTEGRKLVQSARREQRALTRRDIEARVGTVLDRKVVRSYYDLDVRAAEQIEVYILAD